MNLRAAWRALWAGRAKASGAGALVAFARAGQPAWTDRRADQFAEEGYRRNVIAYACVATIARAVGDTTWVLHEDAGEGRRELARHPLLALLARPNPCRAGRPGSRR
jgi:phage portal protein BeeE